MTDKPSRYPVFYIEHDEERVEVWERDEDGRYRFVRLVQCCECDDSAADGQRGDKTPGGGE